MGLLVDGQPLSWEDVSEVVQYVREHGISQFLHIYHQVKDIKKDFNDLLWGDEIEYTVMVKDVENRKVTLSLRGSEMVEKLQEYENEAIKRGEVPHASWKPEYGRHMLEGTPGKPLRACIDDLLTIEDNMKRRREIIEDMLKPDEFVLTISAFFHMGVGCFTTPPYCPPGRDGDVSQSLFVPDEIINPHPRFPTLTRNIRERRNEKVCILIPAFQDVNTEERCMDISLHARENQSPEKASQCTPSRSESPTHIFLSHYYPSHRQFSRTLLRCQSAVFNETRDIDIPDASLIQFCDLPPTIYMDCMAFGMGCSCTQCTYECPSIFEARLLYDQLALVCPVLMALSASTPILRGYLAETDARWHVVSASVDDRTAEERHRSARRHIHKSRYDSISVFISTRPEMSDDVYNDVEIAIDGAVYNRLRDNGIDHLLAKHMSHLFIRDPLVVYKDDIEIDDTERSDHFENVQSTNWQSVRFKPPPPNSDIGWRVEFRVLESQLSDFENAAYVVFVSLLMKAILKRQLDFYIPVSQLDVNMARAHQRDAVGKTLFFFRANDGKCVEMSANEIINGSERFVGLAEFVEQYMDETCACGIKRQRLQRYVSLIRKRASGELFTTARFMRDFVVSHPSYKRDSFVSEEIMYDLVEMCQSITSGDVVPKSLFG